MLPELLGDPGPCTGTDTSWAVVFRRRLLANLIHVNCTVLGLLHNCGWRYFALGSLNKDSRDKFLLEFSSRKCLVSADVCMLPVVRTWKRSSSVSFSHLSKWKTSNKRQDPYLLCADIWEYLMLPLLLGDAGLMFYKVTLPFGLKHISCFKCFQKWEKQQNVRHKKHI